MSHQFTHNMAEVAVGAVMELAKRGGVKIDGDSHKPMEKVGGLAVRGLAAVAPGAVGVAAHGTAVVVAAAAPVILPAAAVAGIGYLAYRLAKWMDD